MSPFMVISVATRGEHLVAVFKTTAVRLLPVVHPNVLLKVSLLVECLSASFVGIWINPFAVVLMPNSEAIIFLIHFLIK